jgi:predicted enzyme related to lactoylglutathione lyase
VQEEGGKIIKETKRSDGSYGGYGYVIIEDPIGAILALAPG